MSNSMAIPSRNKRKARPSPEQETQPQPPSLNADPNAPSSSSSVADNFSSPSMQSLVFPPGFKFSPSDEELIFFYLKPFSQGNRYVLLNVPIHHVNIYDYNPQQLTEKFEKANEKEWLFITERTKKCKGGKYNNRFVNGGYWKGSVTPKTINAGKGVVGNVTSLNFYVGKQPNGVKGDWLMHEYYFESSSHSDDKFDYALCKIYLTPAAEKKKKEAEEEKLKIEQGIAFVDVEALEMEIELSSKVEYQQPQMEMQQLQQPHDIVYQQPHYPLLPLVPHHSQPQNHAYLPQQPSAQYQNPQPQILPSPSNLDDFSEMNLADFDDFLTEFINSLPQYGDQESNCTGFFDDFIKQGMKKHRTS